MLETMKLRLYLKETKTTFAAFAKAIGVTPPAVHRYLNDRVPRPEIMERIEKATHGLVQPNDFYPSEKRSISGPRAAA
jgi:transcriptional regulator with XRE-family HTH domain